MHVGIDLGTTNTALATVDDELPEAMLIPQLVARGAVEARPVLPSFLYLAHESDGKLELPWIASQRFAVGEYARTRGIDAPFRLVSSAKSWLCHPTMDRRAAMLPLQAPADVEKVSPVEASYRYLEHLGAAFDHARTEKLASQSIVLTVPASFDAAARELTVEAAFAAGLEDITLLEEPQAALYAWIAARGDAWRTELKPGDVVLVVDVGGGTTDFSAISVLDREGSLELERTAVGDHILLGGDNMDLLLAHLCKQKLEGQGKTIDHWQMTALVFAARNGKEALLGDGSLASAPVAIASKGSALVGAALRTEITRDEVVGSIVDGFFPLVAADSKPQSRPRSGLAQVGLPYAQDPAVTRHLAHFLSRQTLRPTAVLFNGGVMKSDALRQRVLDALTSWTGAQVRELQGADYDLAVAKGAAVYGRAKAGRGIRIRGGTARSFYVGIESPVPAVPGFTPPVTALCVAPAGMEEGTGVDVPSSELVLVVGEKVRFRFFGSSVRRNDAAGTMLERWADFELEELSPIEATVPAEAGQSADLPVTLRAEVTAIGTLRLMAKPTQRDREPFALELAIREGSIAPPPVSNKLGEAALLVERVFGKGGTAPPKDLVRDLERALGPRASWHASVARGLFDVLARSPGSRRRSADHERVFFALAGMCLRPGFGAPGDESRAGLMAKLFGERLGFPDEPKGWQQFFVAYRRIAGGLDDSAQAAIRDLLDGVIAPPTAKHVSRNKKFQPEAEGELIELAASLERVPSTRRAELGEWLLEKTWVAPAPGIWAAIGRIGAREPAYSSKDHVVSPEIVERWLDHLVRAPWGALATAPLAASRMARLTGDPERDVAPRLREEVTRLLSSVSAPESLTVPLRQIVAMADAERADFYGESLPLGLRLVG